MGKVTAMLMNPATAIRMSQATAIPTGKDNVHPNAKAVSNRLAKAIGHLESVKRMVDRGEDCSDILIQLAAVRSAINNAGKVLLMDHLNHCIVDAVEDGNMAVLRSLGKRSRNL